MLLNELDWKMDNDCLGYRAVDNSYRLVDSKKTSSDQICISRCRR